MNGRDLGRRYYAQYLAAKCLRANLRRRSPNIIAPSIEENQTPETPTRSQLEKLRLKQQARRRKFVIKMQAATSN